MTTTAAILFWSSLCSAVSYLLAGSVVIGGTARGVTLKRAKSNGSKARSTISIVADGAGAACTGLPTACREGANMGGGGICGMCPPIGRRRSVKAALKWGVRLILGAVSPVHAVDRLLG
jgi:hypothetical protein